MKFVCKSYHLYRHNCAQHHMTNWLTHPLWLALLKKLIPVENYVFVIDKLPPLSYKNILDRWCKRLPPEVFTKSMEEMQLRSPSCTNEIRLVYADTSVPNIIKNQLRTLYDPSFVQFFLKRSIQSYQLPHVCHERSLLLLHYSEERSTCRNSPTFAYIHMHNTHHAQ